MGVLKREEIPVDWKSLYNDAFPAKEPFKKYDWPEMPKPKAGAPSKYPELPATGSSPGSAYPNLQQPGSGEGSSYPDVQANSAYPASNYPTVPVQNKMPGNQIPSMRKTDHYGDFAFRVEIEGMAIGAFSKVEGLNVSIEPIEYQHSDDITPRKRFGRIKIDNVRLIKGYVNTADLFDWCESAMKGDISRKSVSIILMDVDHSKELCRYNLFDCWPCKWSSFKLDGMGRGALVEEVELVVEQVERA